MSGYTSMTVAEAKEFLHTGPVRLGDDRALHALELLRVANALDRAWRARGMEPLPEPELDKLDIFAVRRLLSGVRHVRFTRTSRGVL